MFARGNCNMNEGTKKKTQVNTDDCETGAFFTIRMRSAPGHLLLKDFISCGSCWCAARFESHTNMFWLKVTVDNRLRDVCYAGETDKLAWLSCWLSENHLQIHMLGISSKKKRYDDSCRWPSFRFWPSKMARFIDLLKAVLSLRKHNTQDSNIVTALKNKREKPSSTKMSTLTLFCPTPGY